MVDSFNSKIQLSNQLIKTIVTDIKKRQSNTQVNSNIMLEASIRGDFHKLETLIDDLSKLVKLSELSIQEVNRRNKLVNDLIDSNRNIKNKFEQIETLVQDKKLNDNTQLYDKANESYQRMNETEVIQDFHEKIKEQEVGLDVLYQSLKNNRGLNRKMNDEIDNQNQHLTEIDGLMDSTNMKVKTTNKRLEEFANKTSNWFLIMIIIIEIIFFFMVTFII
jgi:aminopeptidase N